jgi:hypothetical protein
MSEKLIKINLELSPYPQLKEKYYYSNYVYFNKKTNQLITVNRKPFSDFTYEATPLKGIERRILRLY